MGRAKDSTPFNIVIVAQSGRLQYEAALLAASLRENDPGFSGRLLVAEPQPGPAWPGDPRISDPAVRTLLADLGAEIVPFENRDFGASYKHGNKIEALEAMPRGEPFLFLDSDTVITGPLSAVPFDFDHPAASMKREGTWPQIELYGPGYSEIWQSLYDRFGLDFDSSLDLSQPDEYWRRYLYFNAGWFFGACPVEFGARFREIAVSIRNDPPAPLVCQPLDPWLDQVALPLVIHAFGGGRPGPELDGLDGDVTWHWRVISMLYATAPDATIEAVERAAAPNKVKKVIKAHEPFRRVIFQGKGNKARALFDRTDLPRREQAIRQRLKKANLWLR